jgi:hypothetical protein
MLQTLGRQPSSRRNLVAEFFRSQKFARIGALVTDMTASPDDITALRVMRYVLMKRIAEVSKWMNFQELIIIFESSQRVDAKVKAEFKDSKLYADGREVPIRLCFLPKAAGEPAAEVADFIVNAVGGQRQGTTGILRKDFRAVFHDHDPRTVSFMKVSAVEISV